MPGTSAARRFFAVNAALTAAEALAVLFPWHLRRLLKGRRQQQQLDKASQ